MGGGSLDRSDITFAQAEGAAPLPRQLQLKEVSKELRVICWAVIHRALESGVEGTAYGGFYLSKAWIDCFFRWEVTHNEKYADEIDYNPQNVMARFKQVIVDADYALFFTLIEFFIRSTEQIGNLNRNLVQILDETKCAYRVVNRSIVPFASEEEVTAVKAAFVNLENGRFVAARTHLAKAGSDLTKGDWAGSIHESVNAVESAARVLAPGTDGLGAALAELEKSGAVHEALKRGFKALYGFSSNENGIRHPLLEGTSANVDEADAMYMFGACAAFISYLALKTKK